MLTGVQGLAVRGTRSRSRTAVHVDTDDLRLTRWGCALARYEDEGWLLTLPAGDDTGPQLVARELRFAPSGRDVPEEAADLLTALTRGARLRPVLRARIEEVTSTVAQRSAGAAAQVRDSRVVAFAGRRIAGRFHDVEVITRSKDTGARVVEALDRLLHGLGAEQSDGAPLLRRALAAAAVEPDVVVHRATKHGSARDAIQRAIAASVLRLLMHDAAVRVGTDPEGVHQARVATRRLRSDLRTFAPLLDEAWTRSVRDDLHRLADLLGAVRDAEVMRARLAAATARLPGSERRAARRPLASLTADRNRARATLLREMRSETYTRLLDELVDAAAHPRTSDAAAGRASTLLPSLAQKPWRRLQARVRDLGPEPADSELHEVRILAKRARYAAEAVAPVSRSAVARFARAVAAVQDELGEHHDAVVAEAWLRESASRGSDAMVMGELIGAERAAAAAARAAWPALWADAVEARPKGWA